MTNTKSICRLISVLLVLLFMLAVSPLQAVRADSHTVTNCTDADAGSLRQAVAAADDGDTVNFNLDCPAAGPLILLSQIAVGTDITISGAGHVVVISGNNANGLFMIQYDTIATLEYLTLKDAAWSDGSDGGAIYDNGAYLTLSHVTFQDNHVSGSGADGGAIFHGPNGTLTILNSTFSGNSAERYGGAIETRVATTITDSTFTGNNAMRGGALDSYASITLTLERVTMNANTAIGPVVGTANTFGQGGAIYFANGTLNINNSTLSGNGSSLYTSYGGAIYIFSATLNIHNSTIVANLINTADVGFIGGGILINDSTLSYYNTIMAGNTSDDCNTEASTMTIAANVNNLVRVSVGCGIPLLTSDPKLGPLADNGGPTQTRALLPGSPAIDAGNDATCLPTDQRGILRPQGDQCDIGAFEVNGYSVYLPLIVR